MIHEIHHGQEIAPGEHRAERENYEEVILTAMRDKLITGELQVRNAKGRWIMNLFLEGRYGLG